MPLRDPAEFYRDWPLWQSSKPAAAPRMADELLPPDAVRALVHELKIATPQAYWAAWRNGDLPLCPDDPVTAWPGRRVSWRYVLFQPLHPI